MEGQGIEEDKAEGIKCYKRAIELGKYNYNYIDHL